MATVVENKGGVDNMGERGCEEKAPEEEESGTGSGEGGLESPKPDHVVEIGGIEPKDNCGRVVVVVEAAVGGWRWWRVSITLCCKEAI